MIITMHLGDMTDNMVKQREVYLCLNCGNIAEIDYAGGANLYCCGQPMKLLQEKTADFATEKHVPYVERVDGGVLVKVGKETAHPMNPDHYIVMIEILADGIYMRKSLRPGDKPEAFFKTEARDITAWEICNIHGLWKS